ncbi:MAG: hypothetical protein JO142_19630 [Burkholderiales bacterium]|nr:hypothetical protein [Burkholderiales bacterium]
MSEFIPPTPPGFDNVRVIERPDGYYWQQIGAIEEYGPFPTCAAAAADIEASNAEPPEIGETLGEMEAEIGIADWVDPDTGQPAEDSVPRIDDQ